ncbi:hypothetical protein C0Q70_17137 [Pomacea canaliculata]|uniref:Uncharacterized protein n=1 Tax=Pomacea canaliculata TaxID=400727 RepID=A0A2T7NRV0_POMCA|nr:hypothetical protein C0Q70_17137 [Pomacea canaliculata]
MALSPRNSRVSELDLGFPRIHSGPAGDYDAHTVLCRLERSPDEETEHVFAVGSDVVRGRACPPYCHWTLLFIKIKRSLGSMVHMGVLWQKFDECVGQTSVCSE